MTDTREDPPDSGGFVKVERYHNPVNVIVFSLKTSSDDVYDDVVIEDNGRSNGKGKSRKTSSDVNLYFVHFRPLPSCLGRFPCLHR